MASVAATAAVSLPSSKSSSLSLPTSRTSISSSESFSTPQSDLLFNIIARVFYVDGVSLLAETCLYPRTVSTAGKLVSIRAQVTKEAPAKVQKVSKKNDEGVIVKKYRPEDP